MRKGEHMKKVLWALLVSSLSATPLVAQAQPQHPASAKVDYEKDVQPLLAQNCYGCHGPEVQQSGLRLDRRQPALRGGDYGPVIIPGKSSESKLIRRLVDGDGGLQMPPSGALTPDEINVLRAWIDQGAESSGPRSQTRRRRGRSIRSWQSSSPRCVPHLVQSSRR
jgi:mono/diheme cytochrome c family protein